MTKDSDSDSKEFLQKKRFFKTILTIFGRNPVMEALEDMSISPYRLHLSESNKPSPALDAMTDLAQRRGIEVLYHSKQSLSRISKNAKQDQGVALDIRPPNFKTFEEFIDDLPEQFELIALDRITNPQNLGMIVRSVCASPSKALLIPEKGCAKLDALVIKASAGTLFKAPLVICENIADAITQLNKKNCDTYALDSNAELSLASLPPNQRRVYVLGNETTGVSAEVKKNCTHSLRIPMLNGVESLNVSITAALLAFRPVLCNEYLG